MYDYFLITTTPDRFDGGVWISGWRPEVHIGIDPRSPGCLPLS